MARTPSLENRHLATRVERLEQQVENQAKAVERLVLLVTGGSKDDLGKQNESRRFGVISERMHAS